MRPRYHSMTNQAQASVGKLSLAVRRPWLVLAVLIAATYAGVLNRQLLTLSTETIKTELHLSDMRVGVIMGLVPGLVTGIGSLFFGALADRAPRHYVLAGSILFWSLATAGLGISGSVIGITLGVAALALGESGLGPIVNAIIPDLFREQRRVLANFITSAAGAMALGIATIMAGLLMGFVEANRSVFPVSLAMIPNWKLSFLLAAALGLPVAAAVLGIGKLPSTDEGAQAASESIGQYVRRHGIVLLGLSGCFAMQGLGSAAYLSWFPSYLVRRFGMNPADVGPLLGIVILCGSLFGLLVTFGATRWLYARLKHRAPYLLYRFALLAAVVPTLALLIAPTAHVALGLLFCMLALVAGAGGHIPTILQGLIPGRFRGRLFGAITLLMGVIPALGPSLVGAISDYIGSPSMGLIGGICAVTTVAFVLAGLLMHLIYKSAVLAAADIRHQSNSLC